MNLYNLLFDQSPDMFLLLNMLDIKNERKNIRVRDCFLNKDGTQIILYTRNGGGNREHYGDCQNDGSKDKPEGPGCSCHGCCIKYELSRNPNYIKDEDDKFDSTYARVWFWVPGDFLEITKGMASGEDPLSIGEKFQEAFKKIQSGDKEISGKIKPVMEQILYKLEGNDQKDKG